MLRDILKDMYQAAFMHGQIPQKRRLKNNLHLTLTCHMQGTTLEIARDDKYPSLTEWKTCINNFPYYTGNPTPEQVKTLDGRFALRAELPSRRKITEQMKLDQLR